MKKVIALATLVVLAAVGSAQYANPLGNNPDWCTSTEEVLTQRNGSIFAWEKRANNQWYATGLVMGREGRISANGRYVSYLNNDSNGVTRLFVRDRQTSTTVRVSALKPDWGNVVTNGGFYAEQPDWVIMIRQKNDQTRTTRLNISTGQEVVIWSLTGYRFTGVCLAEGTYGFHTIRGVDSQNSSLNGWNLEQADASRMTYSNPRSEPGMTGRVLVTAYNPANQTSRVFLIDMNSGERTMLECPNGSVALTACWGESAGDIWISNGSTTFKKWMP